MLIKMTHLSDKVSHIWGRTLHLQYFCHQTKPLYAAALLQSNNRTEQIYTPLLSCLSPAEFWPFQRRHPWDFMKSSRNLVLLLILRGSHTNASSQGWWFEKALRQMTLHTHTTSTGREGINIALQPPLLPSSTRATLRLRCFLKLLLFWLCLFPPSPILPFNCIFLCTKIK